MKYWFLALFATLVACQQADLPLPTEGGGEEGAVAAAAETLVAATSEAHADDEPDATPIADVEPTIGVSPQDSFAYGSTADRNLVGYFVTPENVFEPLPGVILIHEWWGLNDNIKSMARRIAGEGYAVLAVDLYGGAVATAPNEAETLMAAVMDDPQAALANIEQAIDFLEFTLAPTIGTLGWCLGGSWSLQTGLEMADRVDAVVMYYGQVVTDRDRLQLLRAPLLGIFAELDEVVPLPEVQSFRSRLQELDKSSEVFVYTDVEHAFANPSGGAYDEVAANEAWDKTLAFLSANLRRGER